jgi:hypothetical protein
MRGEHRNPEYRIAEDARVATDSPVDLTLGLLTSLLTAVSGSNPEVSVERMELAPAGTQAQTQAPAPPQEPVLEAQDAHARPVDASSSRLRVDTRFVLRRWSLAFIVPLAPQQPAPERPRLRASKHATARRDQRGV